MRAVLPLLVLAVVGNDETYGYMIAKCLEGAGLGTVKGGTLYPILARLEADGLVSSLWREGSGGPGRKYFTITPTGISTLGDRTARWQEFSLRAGHLLNPKEGP